MKPLLKTLLCAIIPLVVCLHTTANAQKEFIDSIRFMLVDLNEQIQYKPINELLQHSIPYCTGDTMNDSLEANLKQLISEDYIFYEGLLQAVSYHLLDKYSAFIQRITSFFLQTGTISEYEENMMRMALAELKLVNPRTVSYGYGQAKKIFLQLQFSQQALAARALSYLGIIYQDQNKPDSAYLMYTQSLLKNPNKKPDENILYVRTLMFLADFCRQHSKTDSALLLFRQLLDVCKKLYGEKSAEYAYWLIKVADFYRYMAKYNLALELGFKALTLTQTTLGEQSNQYAVCQVEIGEIYYSTGEYTKALPYTQRGLDIKLKIFGNDYFDNVVSLHDLATLYIRMGLYNEAIQLLNKSLVISRRYYGEEVIYAFDLHPLADAYGDLGEYDKALPLYQEALQIQGKVNETNFYYPKVLHSIACLYTKLGQYDKAIDFFARTLQLKKEIFGEINPEYTITLNKYAEACLLRGDQKKALSLQLQSLSIAKKLFGNTHPDIAAGLYNLATLYYYENNFKKAEDYCDSALQLQKKILGQSHPDVAVSYDLMGNINEKKHRYNAALEYYQEAFEIRKNIMNKIHPDYINSLYNLGMIYIKKGQIADAAKLLMQADSAALVHIENSYASLSEEEKLIYLHKRENQFQYLPSLLYLHKTNDPEIVNRVYSNAIALKSMVLFHQQQVYNSIRKSNDSMALDLYTKWRFNKAFLGQQILLPPEKRMPGFDSLSDITTQQEETLSNISTTFRSSSLHINTNDIKNHLSSTEAAVEFIKFRLYDNKWTDSIIYAALVLLPGEKNALFVPLFEERQLQKLLRYVNSSEAAVNYLYPDAKKETTISKALYDLVWKPLQPMLDTIHTVNYAPCGLLYRISFSALHNGKAKYLNDKYFLRQMLCTRNIFSVSDYDYFTTASVWGDIDYNNTNADTCTSDKNGKNIAIKLTYSLNSFNNAAITSFSWQPLPETKKEIDNVVSLLEQKNIACDIKTRTSANEAAFKKMNGHSPAILHVATHAFFLSADTTALKNDFVTYNNAFAVQQDPMFRTGLVLAGANTAWTGISANTAKEDEVLTAYEISQLDLSDTKLVTLSACETALGDIQDNEGVFGLQRAFKMAGAKQVLMSLWKVPDKETVQFMTLFYTNLMNNNNANIALHNAQLVMKEKYAPYYWAGFVLTE